VPILFFIISFLASIIGSICGIGGGVIIKPTMDLLQMGPVATISFLSGCTVLSMTSYTVGRALISRTSQIDLKLCTPLAIGAVVGGISGNSLFAAVKSMFSNPNTVGAVQAFFLAIVTIGTLIYTLMRNRILTRQVESPAAIALIGAGLGLMSSFLGIGGGPINLVVLYYFFSMSAKIAAQNSLFIILFSQFSSLATTVITGKVPSFDGWILLLMIAGGIVGGITGRSLNKRLDDKAVSNLFVALMAVIIGISVFNVYQYASVG